MSPNPAGPWTTCTSVPQEIYTIPSSTPVYNVTCYPDRESDGTVTQLHSRIFGNIYPGRCGAILPMERLKPPYCYGGYTTLRWDVLWRLLRGYGYHYPTPYYDSQRSLDGNRLPMGRADRRRAVPVQSHRHLRARRRLRLRMGAEAQQGI
ncbi:MAG: hypothetical protein Udaeo2_26910 [Candidatus Udaeobacter sp.]|nr:MAG: hypothetical protein Udaeo2_26910 [Candidatus Udaeobacter sp.]